MDPGEQGTRRVHGALGVVAVAAPAVEPDQEPVDAELVAEGATAPARVTSTIRPDTVFMPFHWGGDALANAVTNDATDPVSGMPEFKVCAVSVARADEMWMEQPA